jgi:hypothetical protein
MTAYDTEVISVWLDQSWPSGIIAVGGCDAEGKIFSNGLGDKAARQIADQCWMTLNEAVAQLAAYDFGEGQSKWVFENAIIYSVRRPDGAWAGIMAPRGVPQTLQATVQSRLAQFASATA